MKDVFEISGESRYDDVIDERYHFPAMYRKEAERVMGDWVLYRETGAAGGRLAYVAVARVVRIDQDQADPSHFYARVSDFLRFDRPVPYRDPTGRFAERFLRELPSPATAGRALRGRSIRTIDGADFAAIVAAGLDDVLDPRNAIRLDLDLRDLGLSTTPSALGEELGERRVEQILLNRWSRTTRCRRYCAASSRRAASPFDCRRIEGIFRGRRVWIEEGSAPRVLRYELRSLQFLLFCLFAAGMAFFMGLGQRESRRRGKGGGLLLRLDLRCEYSVRVPAGAGADPPGGAGGGEYSAARAGLAPERRRRLNGVARHPKKRDPGQCGMMNRAAKQRPWVRSSRLQGPVSHLSHSGILPLPFAT